MTLPPLTKLQTEIAQSDARFRVVACGRRAGKSTVAVAVAVHTALRGLRVWWVAPSYRDSNVGWRGVKALMSQVPGCKVSETDRRITSQFGGWIEVRTADNPQGLRSEGLDLIVIDEAAFVHEDAWIEALRPALADRKGKALIISTPLGRNWFWRAFQKGMDPAEKDWKSWHAPTSANPFIDPREIEAARRDMPERKFRQEILAEFIDDAGAVFRRVREAVDTTDASLSGQLVAGIDWGKSNDFTVFTVIDVQSHRVVYLDRFNQIDYRLQRARLVALNEQFRPITIVAEANSIGEPLIEDLLAAGLPVQRFMTTASTKATIIDALVLAFETGAIRIPDDPVLIGELESFEAERLPSGALRYSAPEGCHDDTVMATALAWHAAAQPAFGMSPVKISRGAGRAF